MHACMTERVMHGRGRAVGRRARWREGMGVCGGGGGGGNEGVKEDGRERVRKR